MTVLKSLSLLFAMSFSLCMQAQQPENFPLWPQGAKESNGMKAPEKTDENGGISNSNQAELLVYHPDPEKSTGMVVVICPGGGYEYLAMNHEGEQFAHWLTARGITAIVLKYRMPNGHNKIPLTDASRAIRWVRSRAEEWSINPEKIGIAGFSAGGHVASTVATHFDKGKPNATDRLDRYGSRPDFVILFYPVISMTDGLTHAGSRNGLLGKIPSAALIEEYSNERHVTTQTPPAFLVHSDDDTGVSPLNSIAFYQALKKNKVPAAMYIFPKGGHGWGLNQSFEYYEQWTWLLDDWLKKAI